jgi:hypothetical protein
MLVIRERSRRNTVIVARDRIKAVVVIRGE